MKKLFFLLLFVPCISFGQSLNRGIIEQKHYHDTIPFELVRGKILVDVEIQGKTRKFFFDTGAPLMISPALQEEMKNKVLHTAELKDVTGQGRTSQMVLVPEFSLGAITFQQSAGVVQALDNGMMACFEIEGVVGSNVLRNSVVHIDAANKRLIITQQADRLGLDNAYKSKMKLDGQSRPFIIMTVGKQAKLKALFDSGSDKFMSLSGKTYQKLEKKQLAHSINEGIGSMSSGIYGAATFRKQYRLQIENLTMGAASLEHVVATASAGKSKNAMGMELADYGTLTMDFPNKQFYFTPTTPTQAFRNRTTFGFKPQYNKDHFRVGVVYSNTPAEKQGLKSGYRILKINEFDVSANDRQQDCALFLSNVQQQPAITLTFVDEHEQVKTIELRQE